MDIPVLIEPIPTGFRASTQSPVALVAEGKTKVEVMAALSVALNTRLQHGSSIQLLTLPEPNAVLAICAEMRADPKHAEMEAAFVEYRKIANAVPDAE